MPRGALQRAISQIVQSLPEGVSFDSHYVIRQLIKFYTNEYLAFAGTFNPPRVNAVHGQIAILIGDVAGVAQQQMQSYSENIHGESCLCALWQKNQ